MIKHATTLNIVPGQGLLGFEIRPSKELPVISNISSILRHTLLSPVTNKHFKYALCKFSFFPRIINQIPLLTERLFEPSLVHYLSVMMRTPPKLHLQSMSLTIIFWAPSHDNWALRGHQKFPVKNNFKGLSTDEVEFFLQSRSSGCRNVLKLSS
jgi:hypothetical protein